MHVCRFVFVDADAALHGDFNEHLCSFRNCAIYRKQRGHNYTIPINTALNASIIVDRACELAKVYYNMTKYFIRGKCRVYFFPQTIITLVMKVNIGAADGQARILYYYTERLG